MRYTLHMTVFVVVALGATAAEYSHKDDFTDYEGTKTCLECHREEAESFFHSQHYQWQGKTPNLVNSAGKLYGKMNTINDFCTNPSANWIGPERNEEGKVIATGCSKCHPSRGKRPSTVLSEEQLLNIDCLICHASGYRRDLYENEDGSAEWKSILWKNKEGLNSVSKRLKRPTRTMCLRCHSASGGGPNYKRGDIEYELRDCDREFDVHMSSDGGDMHCVDCHAGEDHRVRGRGVDLAATDSPDNPLSCGSGECHESDPHEAKVLNHHAKRVACAACHIGTFAKADATDMARDWSKPLRDEETGKYGATIEFGENVVPVYAWYNGNTWAQLPEQPVKRLADGKTIGMMMPQGSREDETARIHPFKLHRGKLPVLEGKDWIIPIVVEKFFVEGDIEAAVRNAAKEMYDLDEVSYAWTDTVRYMGIFHEVQPKENALSCLDCHSPDGRMNWEELGYEGDPLDAVFSK